MIIRERTGFVVLLGAMALALIIAIVFPDVAGVGRKHVPWDHPYVERDLDSIALDTLRVLVLRDPLTWEERPGAISGLEFELLERFAKAQGIPIRAVPVEHPDSMFNALQQGHGDVIAAQYAVHKEHRKWVSATASYHHVRPMLAQLREDPLERTDTKLPLSDTIYLSAWSPFRGVMPNVRRGPVLVELPGTPEDLLMDVVLGRIPAALVSDGYAGHEAKRFPTIEFSELDGPQRHLCFAVRRNAPQLLEGIDAWLNDEHERSFRRILIDSYQGTMSKAGALRKRTMPAQRDSISPYDAEFHEFGGGGGWKWQLLAAMAWKESRFDSTAVSNQGAMGIMQIMPGTATRLGLDSNVTVADHIAAAKRYVGRLDTLWMRAVPDRDQRLRFVLASYNAGPGHIIDAQRLAEHLGLDPKKWEHNVERAVLLLAKPRYYARPEMKNGYCKGSQVFHYVRDITAMYEQLTRTTARPPATKPAAD